MARTLPVRLLLLALLSASPALAGPILRIQPGTAKPGDPVLISILGTHLPPSGTLGRRPLRFYATPTGFEAISPLLLETPPGPQEVRVSLPQPADARRPSTELVGSLDVVPAEYPSRELKVDKKYVQIPRSVRKRIEEDRKAFARALSQVFGPRTFTHNFIWPRPPDITAPFGDRRVFNGKLQSQHYGTDLEGRVGDPILAGNDGVVVLARDCYASGKTVILHHGGNLFTLYFHQSQIIVKQGDVVKQGDLLGHVGSTGRVTGPHLHWSAKVEEHYVDAATLRALDFE